MVGISEIVWLGHDNTIDLILYADGVAQDLSSVTRMTLEIGTVTVDSAVHSGAFDWDPTPAVTGKVILALGTITTGAPPVYLLSAGSYEATLTVYDPTNDDGVVWKDIKPFRITVK